MPPLPKPISGSIVNLNYYAAPAMYYIGGPTAGLRSTENKINSFANLPDGWDYGDGGSIPKHTRDTAIAWDRLLQTQGFIETDAFPGADGEIVVAVGIGEHYFEVIIEPDDTISLAYDFRRKQVSYRPNMTSMEAVQAILELTGQICGVSGYYTQINTTKNRENLHVPRFATPRMTDVYRSWEWNVSTAAEDQFVPILGSFTKDTPELWESPPFFGSLNPIFYQRRTV
jgi:hypothetical protein